MPFVLEETLQRFCDKFPWSPFQVYSVIALITKTIEFESVFFRGRCDSDKEILGRLNKLHIYTIRRSAG